MTKRNGGFSLVEVLVAIVLLGAMIVPTCTSLVLSLRVNEKTDAMLQAQLDVSSAVEHLMASGVTEAVTGGFVEVVEDKPDWMNDEDPWEKYVLTQDATNYVDAYEKVYIVFSGQTNDPYYNVTVTDLDGLVTVETSIRKEGT